MDLSLWSIEINNWSADKLKKHTHTQHLNELSLEPALQSGDTGQWMLILSVVIWP